MAKTFETLLEEARVILQDTDSSSYRYTEAVLLSKLNRGLMEIGRLRPEVFMSTFSGSDIVVPEVVTGTPGAGEVAASDAVTDTLPIMFYPALVYFVAASAELIDDEFTNDGRAGVLLAAFKTQVVSL